MLTSERTHIGPTIPVHVPEGRATTTGDVTSPTSIDASSASDSVPSTAAHVGAPSSGSASGREGMQAVSVSEGESSRPDRVPWELRR